MLLILYIIFLFGNGIYFFLKWNYNYWEKRGIPSPKPGLFVGNFPGAVKQKVHIIYEMQKIYEKYKGRYSFVGIYNMRTPQLMVTDAAIAKDILINKFRNFHDNEIADMTNKESDPIFGRNPFVLKGEEWKQKRAEITPAFTQMRIKAMYPVLEDVCGRMKKYILKENHQAIEARELIAKFTTDVVSSCIFGIDAGSFVEEKPAIREMGRRITEFTPRIIFYFIMVQLIPSLRHAWKVSFSDKTTQKFFVNIMKDAIDLRKKSNSDRTDYLHYLLELKQKKNLTDHDLVGHAITFFIDGFETSSIIMSFALYELAKYPEVQKKLREEIRETIQKHGEISFEVIHEMPYLDLVVSESIRLHPPAPFVRKRCTETCELPITKNQMVTIEKGWPVLIPIYNIHRDARYFEDPEKFIPERFAPEKGGIKIHREKGSYLPFGDGPRMCLGMRFGQAQLRAAIVAIVKDFEITVDSKTAENIVMNPSHLLPSVLGGLWLQFKEIK
ncbi:probable cytochrome P450 28d1 [Lutzomyia longipalpis]|uniref:probable cytochrome P450 28d1 n=1 Tax=Lutzomyia longipalpis TaxID=7200 RepID=UPI0024835BAD|nr:probable cytochrome P450 28d1 [Lutzomyia longipalpis]